MPRSEFLKLKLTLDHTHDTLSKIKGLKAQVTRAFTEGLYDREFYLYILNDMQRLETETRRYIQYIEQKITQAGYKFDYSSNYPKFQALI